MHCCDVFVNLRSSWTAPARWSSTWATPSSLSLVHSCRTLLRCQVDIQHGAKVKTKSSVPSPSRQHQFWLDSKLVISCHQRCILHPISYTRHYRNHLFHSSSWPFIPNLSLNIATSHNTTANKSTITQHEFIDIRPLTMASFIVHR